MKNNKLLLIIIFFFIFCKNTYGENFTFEASNLTFEDDSKIIYGSNGIKITLEKDTEILAGNFVYNKITNILKVSNNVKINNEVENIYITGEEFIYNISKEKISSQKDIKAEIHNQYFLETNHLEYDLINKTILSNKPSKIKDVQKNQLFFKNFIFSLSKKIITSQKLHFIDYETNNYYLENVKLNTLTRKIIGKDLTVDFDNSSFGDKNNNPRLKGNSVTITNDSTEIIKGIFTTCKKNGKCPPWTLQSEKVTHDKNKKSIIYKNALLKFYDIPIMYFPKFFHPDPTVKRQSGFLPPKFTNSNSLGFGFELPYFNALADNRDLTFKPIYTGKKGIILNTEYREVRKNSKHIVDFSATNEKVLSSSKNNPKFKNHFFSNSVFDLDIDGYLDSSLELDLQRVSNEHYLKSYDFNSPLIKDATTLNSKVDFNGYNVDSSLNITAEIYEDLSKERNDKYEYVLPSYNYSKIIRVDGGLINSIDFDSSGSYRNYETNKSEQLIINDMSFNSKSFLTDLGIASNYNLNLKNLNYKTNNSNKFKEKKDSDIFSSIMLNYAYPLKKVGVRINSLLSPKLSLRYSPSNTNNQQDENKSISVENVYSFDRMNSPESVESGQSLTLGFDYLIETLNQRELFEIEIAQIFRDIKNNDLPKTNNMDQKRSDIMGAINFNPNSFLNLQYNFSADNNLKSSNYDFIKSTVSINNFVTSFEFLEETNNFGNNGYWKNTSKILLNEKNSLSFEKRRNTKKDIDEYYNLIYSYENDCLIASIKYNKNFYKDGNLQPNEEIFFSIAIIPFSEASSPNLK
jgi:LPS-assembly protein